MSKITLFVILTILLTKKSYSSTPINVGTVLFTTQDMHRSCWTVESASLLTTRMILEDLMPPVEEIKVDSNDFVDDLMTYYREIISVVREQTKGKRKHIVLLALTDIIGGYLKMAVIPRAKTAYYAGIIDFKSMERLIQLYEELKWFLRTNGVGWGKSNEYNTAVKVKPLDMDTVQCKQSCDAIIYYTKSQLSNVKKVPRKNNNNTEIGNNDEKEKEPNFIFPIPYFDSSIHPNAIAIPFKHNTLRNIEAKKSNNLIMNFFKAVYTCMDDKKVDQYSRRTFYNQFYSWINRECIPKTEDDKFYAAFGGILRVEDALRSFGAELIKIPTTTTVKFDEEGLNEAALQETGNSSYSSSNSSLVILAILIAIFVWFMLGVLFICFRIRSKRRYHCSCSKSSLKKDSSSKSPKGGSSSSKSLTSDSRTFHKCTCEMNNSSNLDTNTSKTSKSSRNDKNSNHTNNEQVVATIETMQSLKLLPSIAEISERSTTKDDKHNIYDSEETSNSSSFSLESNEDLRDREQKQRSYSIYHHEEYLKRKGVLQRKLKACDSKKYSQGSVATKGYSSSTQRDSYCTENSTSEENVSKSNNNNNNKSGEETSSSGLVTKDKVEKETSDFSTDATSQLLKTSPMPKKKTSDETSSGSSEVNPSELRRIISANTSHHKEMPQDIKILPHQIPCHTDLSKPVSSEEKKKYSIGYDFHTTSSGESSIESDDSASENASSSR